MTQLSDDPQAFLKTFFGAGNSIQWADYENAAPADAVRAYLEPWVQRFIKQESPFLLPRVDISSKQTTWYVLCGNPREARSMRESLLAFVGPTYSRFNGELATLDPKDSIEEACQLNFGSLVFRLPVIDNDDRTKVGRLLTTLVDYRDRESGRSLAAVKPIGRLLRDLEMAILAKNEQSAWSVYGEIRSRGRLSATNLAFLQVRIFGAFEQWAELLLLPNLNDILQVRRPKRISDQIAQAVYQHQLAEHELAGDATEAVAAYRRTGKRFQNLVRSTAGLQSPEAIKFALVSAVAADVPQRELAERLAGHTAIATDAAWAEALLATLPAQQSAEVVSEAVTAYDVADVRYNENNFDEALALYLMQTPTRRSVHRVLETAVEVDTRQSAEEALAYLSSAPEDIQTQILGRRVCTGQIEILSGILGQDSGGEPKQIASLVEWFEFVDAGEAIETASEVLDYGIQEWASGSSFDASAIAQELKKSRSGKQNEIIRNAVPTFIRSLLLDRSPTRECKPVYGALTELLIYDESVGSDDLAAVEQLSEAVLTTAPCHEAGNNDFAFAAEITVHLWDTIAAPRHFDWVLSMLDLLIDTGGQQHTSLTPILATIAESSRLWTRRISDDQWSLLELLATDLDLTEMVAGLRPEPEEATENDPPDIRGLLIGKSIAVYSLTERIARRFGQLAEKAFDGIKIHYVHDKSLTDRMKSLAQSADIFIVNTWDAKHAATNGIKDNRSSSAYTLEPDGKSASSLMRCLHHFALNRAERSQ
ncbi:protein DpdD [Allorhodopirellula solitaria]|uniref:Uncharacterized protein n=1 Tax=Allorhodopirellula solitaria TaxID=2527987 RepID=A0A5C5WPB9_9BACT|nr:protein DpdD [Allorhodopirellula solitaria]TWT52270.1 hypothetical protein CA85_50500 [Allorhodopirellula solitaria]